MSKDLGATVLDGTQKGALVLRSDATPQARFQNASKECLSDNEELPYLIDVSSAARE